jgi:hypothetical protein
MDRENFKAVISESFAEDRLDANIKAYDLGTEMVVSGTA